MARINARTKGASGEREFCDYLHTTFALEEKPCRDLEQSRSGGADVICPPFAFEVKRRETLDLSGWWLQISQAVKNKNCSAFGLVPVVAYRQNRKPWEFLIGMEHLIPGSSGFVHVSKTNFERWVKFYLSRIEVHYSPLLISGMENQK